MGSNRSSDRCGGCRPSPWEAGAAPLAFRQPHLPLAHLPRISQVRDEVGRMLWVIQDHRTLSLFVTLLFAGRFRNSLQTHQIWPAHGRYVIWVLVVGNKSRSANRFEARVIVVPLVLAMKMEARLSHQRVPARSRFNAVSRSGKSGALAHSLHSLPAYSLQTLHSRLDT
ncbi:hypothetical protein B0T20DRAFT_191434 [Sordaria brevicollis]|uniref:Uncharacterized protein n=1 Tax=Sordaria brevicollis TaxID=83679 RepID=A0AAE0UCJ3_SORBR|nr:hypothetical protein B0T20DRAFT_191434 [Sordaria brevicollis]